MANFDNPILEKIAVGVEEKLKPELKAAYLAIVVSGMKVMFSKETHRLLLERLKGELVPSVAKGIAQLIAIIANEAQGKMSVPAAQPAALTLMCYALDFAEKQRKSPVTAEEAAACAQATALAVLKILGIDQAKIDQAKQESEGQTQNPAQPGMPAEQPEGAAPQPAGLMES